MRVRKLGIRIIIAFVALLLLAVSYVSWMSWEILSTWHSSHGKPSDCAIVLGTAVWDGKPSTAMRERLDIAVQVYQKKLAAHLILSGGIGRGDRLSEAEVMKDYLIGKGIPEEALLLEESSHSTMENLQNSQRIMKEQGFSSAVLITHGFHTLRARLMAESLGIPVSVEPVQIRPIALRYYVLREAAAIPVFELQRLL